jgi:hypothetical protein
VSVPFAINSGVFIPQRTTVALSDNTGFSPLPSPFVVANPAPRTARNLSVVDAFLSATVLTALSTFVSPKNSAIQYQGFFQPYVYPKKSKSPVNAEFTRHFFKN